MILLLAFLPASLLLWHLVPFFLDPYGLRKYPGPFFAKFTDLWLGYQARRGRRSVVVHKLHQKYGPIVRLGPNHLSLADPDALHPVYGHHTGTLKSPFYDAFVSVQRGLFNTRDRVEHARKRKIVSHVFATSSIKEFEPYIAANLAGFIKKWDTLCVQNGKRPFDILPWMNYLAFDVIGDLAFGAPFGMVNRGADIAEVEDEQGNVLLLPAVKILNERGEFSATQGVLMPWLRPYTKYLDPWFQRGFASVQHLAGIARHRVNKRLQEGAGDRKDLLARLQEGKDAQGSPLPIPELTAEALTQLIAGSDTTSNSSCAICYWLASNPQAQLKLAEELHESLQGRDLENQPVLQYDEVKHLKYLEACILEALRIHSTSGIGLPRIMVEDVFFKGHRFPAGSILSVPTYTIHRSKEHWGADADAYRPERWFEEDKATLREKAFNPFSTGPRGCVGKNLAMAQLIVFISSFFARYEMSLAPQQRQLEVSEGFLRKPLEAWLVVQRRAL